jgi:hypothetical protein
MSDGQREFAAPRGPQGRRGERGEQGERGAAGDGMPPRSRRAVAVLIVVLFALEGLNLEFTAQYENHTQQAQRTQSAAIIRKVCAGFGELAAEKPPAGNPAKNPSRAFDDTQHAVLVGIGHDLCR